MHRKGKTEASFESPEFFHMKFVPLVHDKFTTSHKLLRPELTYRCSPENTLIKPTQPINHQSSPSFHNFNKNTASLETQKIPASRHFDLKKGTRPDLYYTSSLYSNYSQALKESRFNRHKSDLQGIPDNNRKIIRNELRTDLQRIRLRIDKARERKRELIEYLKRIRNS